MKLPLALIAGSALSMAAAVALGHSGATGVVKERMDLMGVIGDANKALTEMMRGKTAYDAVKVRELAETIGSHGGEAMTKLFPEGSIEGPSEALPAIWSEWESFSDLAVQLTDYASALSAAADNERAGPMGGDMMQQGGGMMGGQGQGMMQQGGGMMAGQGQGMMQQGSGMMNRPSAEMLAQMPPDAAFMHLVQTCSACHQDFRKEKQ